MIQKLDKIDILCAYNQYTMDVEGFGTTSTSDDSPINSVFPIDKKYKNDIQVSFNRYAFNQRNGELRVSMNSHVLGRNYPDKIRLDNLEDCLRTVLDKTSRDLFDPKELIQRGYSNHVHATEDIRMSLDKNDYRHINSVLAQPAKWHNADRNRNSYGWKSKLSGDLGKEMFKAYDKGNQMKMKKRQKFMLSNDIPINTFDGILRLEVKLQSPELIRRRYQISDNKVMSILTSQSNPVVNFIANNFNLTEADKIIKENKMPILEKLAFMKERDNDWSRIQQDIRIADPTNASKIIKTYHKLYLSYVESPTVRTRGAELLNTIVDLINNDNTSSHYLLQQQAA